MARYFLGLAERLHARMCMEAGVVVLGIKGPAGVKKLSPGDGVVYYSPKTEPDGETLQAFTAIGEVVGEDIYERSFGGDTLIWVRNMEWQPDVHEAPIRPLLEDLSWIKKPQNWGFYMRGSSREITAEDFTLISRAMGGRSS